MELIEITAQQDMPMELLLSADPAEQLVLDYLKRGICIGATDLDTVIAVYVLLPTRPDTIELVNIAVDEAYQGKGIAKKLIADALERARELQFKTIEVGTGNSSLSQLALYQKMGFKLSHIEHGFFLRHYDEEIYENGIQCVDMVRLTQDL